MGSGANLRRLGDLERVLQAYKAASDVDFADVKNYFREIFGEWVRTIEDSMHNQIFVGLGLPGLYGIGAYDPESKLKVQDVSQGSA